MFGIGMQMGGGCASGTLFTAGGGNARMVVTLVFFIVGSLLATINFDWWVSLPSFQPVTLVSLGAPVGIAVSLALFAAIAALTVVIEKRRNGGKLEQAPPAPRHGLQRYLRGPWPLVFGAVALAILNFVTLALAGRPWGITSAFALWGAKAAQLVGIDPTAWAYWQMPGNARALSESVFADITSVMNFGIIAGAMLAAALAGRFALSLRIPLRSLLAAVIGGLLLGYGAHRLWLQYRSLLLGHRVRQPAWLAVGGGGIRGQHRRREAAALLLRGTARRGGTGRRRLRIRARRLLEQLGMGLGARRSRCCRPPLQRCFMRPTVRT